MRPATKAAKSVLSLPPEQPIRSKRVAAFPKAATGGVLPLFTDQQSHGRGGSDGKGTSHAAVIVARGGGGNWLGQHRLPDQRLFERPEPPSPPTAEQFRRSPPDRERMGANLVHGSTVAHDAGARAWRHAIAR